VEVNSFAEALKLLRNCPTAEFFHHEELGPFDIDLRKWSCSSAAAAAAISAAPSLMLPIEVVFWICKFVSVCYCQNPFLFFFFSFSFFFFLAVDDPQLQQLHLKLHP
jgi:hypothetical protein